MQEFELIDEIVAVLGPQARGDDVLLGPGDDGCAIRIPGDQALVSSLDSLVAGVHFPQDSPARWIGYRALMVGLSDLAAMGATPIQVLVGLTLPAVDTQDDVSWVRELTLGMRDAAQAAQARVLGGNIARGPLNIAVSVHGCCPEELLLTRSGAQVGDGVYVTGSLGGASAALALGRLDEAGRSGELCALAGRYFKPAARLPEGVALRGHASSAIDVSDGLLQDLSHVCRSSGVGARLDSKLIPVMAGASLEQALRGGDDYELLFTASEFPALDVPVTRIGEIVAEPGVQLDGEAVEISGYQHF